MKFLKNLHYIDILLFISALPVFFALPFFMKIYVISALLAILFNKPNIKIFYVLGIVALLFSFFEIPFNDRFVFYMKFLSSLLFMAVLLQKMKKEYNFYMKLSPVLFLIFSVVFFQNIYMLFYIVFEIFVFIYALVSKDVKNSAFGWSVKIFVFSLPFVVLLFLFFPRPHMKNIKFGLQSQAVSGFSEVLRSNASEIIKRDTKVAEYRFDRIPNSLYFRGAVLYKRVGVNWIALNNGVDKLISYKKKITYTLKQYPTLKRNIFALDLPVKNKNLILTPFYTLLSKKPLKNIFFSKLASVEGYVLKAEVLPKEALYFNKNYNKKAQKEAKRFLKIKDKTKRLKALEEFFKNQKIVYTTKPKHLDGLNIVDSLFEKKGGYCTHFASAFALFARMAGIPSRIIVGYLGKRKNLMENYLVIRESDAHAWVEVYINRWIRVDPTSFAYKNEVVFKTPSKFQMWIGYVRFLIEEWILNYDYFKQQKFLRWLKKNSVYFFVLFGGFIVVLAFFVFRCDFECRLRKKLKKMGYEREISVYRFLEKRDKRLNELYHKWKFYKVSKEEFKELKKLISKL